MIFNEIDNQDSNENLSLDEKNKEKKFELINSNLNHRQRLIDQFLKNPSSLAKYQVLELLLIFSIPQKDLKPLSKELLEKFGSLNGILQSSEDSLLTINGMGKKTVAFLKCVLEISKILLQEEVVKKNHLPLTIEKIAKYSMFSLGHLNFEKVAVFMFDSKKNFIKEYFHSKGTLSYSPLYIRELLWEVLNTKAAFIVLVHNHPSGNVYPSSADIDITKKIHNLLQATEVCLYDHLIVSSSQYISIKNLGLF